VLVFFTAAAGAGVVAAGLGVGHGGGFLEIFAARYFERLPGIRQTLPRQYFRIGAPRTTMASFIDRVCAMSSNPYLITAGLLLSSNIFMTYA
jgi:hypothetical protein